MKSYDLYLDDKFVQRIHYLGYLQIREKELKDKGSVKVKEND